MSRRAVSLSVLAFVLALLILLAADVLLVIFAGILFGVFLSAGAGLVSRVTGVGRGGAIALFILLVTAGLIGSFLAFAPAMLEQADELARQLPPALESLRDRISSFSWGPSLLGRLAPSRLMSGEGGFASTAVSATFGAIGNFVIILFVGLYAAIDPGLYRRGLRALLSPELRPRGEEVMDVAGHTLRNWLGGQLISMSFVGLFTWLGLWLIGIPLAFILGLIAAILTFIPNIGPVLSAVPALLLAMPEGWSQVGLVLAVFLTVQAVESYVVTPIIQKERVSLPPALIISAQLLMGVLFGLMGLLLATPLAALVLALVREVYVHDYLEERQETLLLRDPPDQPMQEKRQL
ncbi:AI-2E family transporter [Cereibacter azotoformans]|uniref:AI-2E family transporter n=2 Tax=Cereibacter TaxID=1653176 RepID=A4WR43_CERS5|nr:AI-2E family transporter [Cereibacter azotoformans]AXQ95055.1 AI-2E family transporter [Cereibacter sphaeroides]MBO4169240.1 AI-2E family transporter [Cereibacter azotoformans]PTR15868.1 putative PurR-regulated permease PerM [Cereibacter azotoformans]UIJ31370.1 AI-2E family transporter [Cereibacter azotoformans]ULB09207.1 AI-2E family transporter [Cereibacter azotoformans]